MVEKEDYSWLYDDLKGLKQKIVYRDRIEYRLEGELHNPVGPALIKIFDPLYKTYPSDDDFEYYYIKGEKLEKEQWEVELRGYKLNKLIKKTKGKDGKNIKD